MSPSSGAARPLLAVVLRERKDLLIAEWTDRVLNDPEVPEATRLSEPALRDHIPGLLDDVIAALVDSMRHTDDASSEVNALHCRVDRPARLHALHRFQRGYTLAEALRELSHFRAVVVDQYSLGDVSISGQEARLLHGAIDAAMSTVAVEMEQAARADLEIERERLRDEGAFRERFIGILGHDLRNPLSAVTSGATLLLKRQDTPEESTQVLRRVLSSAERMARMIRDLLDFARTRSGGDLPLAPKQADLHAVCLEVIEELRLAHPCRTIALGARGDAGGAWDPDRLAQLLQNLVGNAIEYSPPDTPVRVTIEARGAAVTLKVRNLGTLIPPEQLSSLFEPFARGAGERPPHGLGLGLFIAHEIVKAHGGTIDVTSRPKQGTVFTVSLPRAPLPSPPPRREEEGPRTDRPR